MTLHYEDAGLRLWHGPNKDILPTFDAESFDSIVTDPPYELGFMGKGWDSTGIAYDVDLWRECWRVLKPGGYLLSFGGTRTWHRIAVAIEDAGFEIRDSIAWMYASGFPKSLNVGNDERFCRCSKGESEHGRDDVRGVREGVLDLASDASAGSEPDVLADVQREASRSRMGEGRSHGAGGEDARALRIGRTEDAGVAEPGVEGRRHVQTAAGELRAPAYGAVPAGVREHGAVERVRTAASARHGAMDRATADALGVREPQGSRHVEQLAIEPRALADEPGSQARGIWPVCGGCGKPQITPGLGTALKPAFEPIIVARKPLRGTVAANVLAYGTGALNIDACRVHTEGSEAKSYKVKRLKPGATLNKTGGNWRPEGEDAATYEGTTKAGRFPANVLLDESQAAELDKQSGVLTSGKMRAGTKPKGERKTYGQDAAAGYETTRDTPGDSGGASRFFPTFRYEAKAPGSERPEVDGMMHATVKPLELMRWMVRLVTRPGGRVLDLFAGSGTTGEAALLEGMEVDLIELEATHLPLILQRVRKPLQPSMFGDWEGIA